MKALRITLAFRKTILSVSGSILAQSGIDIPLLHPDGRVESLRASDGTLLYWVGVNLDIEERKRADEGLRRSEAYLSEAPPFNRFAGVGLDPFIIKNHCATKREMF